MKRYVAPLLVAYCLAILAPAVVAFTPVQYSTVGKITFKVGETTIDDTAADTLLRTVEHIEAMRGATIVVIAHGDEVASEGNPKSEQQLASIRAAAIERFYEENLHQSVRIMPYGEPVDARYPTGASAATIVVQGYCGIDYHQCEKFWPSENVKQLD